MIQDPYNKRPLPAGWNQHHDQRGTCYYVNTNTMPPQVSYTHPADENTTRPSSQAFSQQSLAQQLYASSVNAAIGSSPGAPIHANVLQPSIAPLNIHANGNPISPPISTNVPPSRESSYGLSQSTLGQLPTFSSTGAGSSTGFGLTTHNLPVQSRQHSYPGIGIPQQYGQSMNPLLPGQHDRQNTMPSVTLIARPPSQVYFDRLQTHSPPLIAPKPQLPPGSHNIELSPTSSDTFSPPFSPQMNQTILPVVSPQSFASYQPQPPLETNTQMTTGLAARKAKEGAQHTVKALKKMGKASKNVGKAALKMGGAMLTSPTAGTVANNALNPNTAATLINAFTTMQSDEGDINLDDLQAVIQGQPDADYQSILSALSAQQQLMQMQSTTSMAQAPLVDYQSLIAELQRTQQISAQQQAQANMASAISQAQAQAHAQQNTAASLQNMQLQNMYLQAMQTQATSAHRALTPAALYQNSVQFQAMRNGESNNALTGGPYTNMQATGTSQANGAPLRPNSISQNSQPQVLPAAAAQGNMALLHRNAPNVHSQASGSTAHRPPVSSRPLVPANGQPVMNANNLTLSPQDLQNLVREFLKQQQQQMMDTANSPSQQTQSPQVQLLQTYQEHPAPLLQPPAQASQPETLSNVPNPQQLHAQQSPQSPPSQQQYPQRSPSISQGMSDQRMQYSTSPSSVYTPNQSQQLQPQPSPQSPPSQQQYPQRPPSISQGMSDQRMQYPTSPSSVHTPNQSQQLHPQPNPQSPHSQQQHPQRPPSISRGVSNQRVQYPTSPSSAASQHRTSPSIHQQQSGSQETPNPMHHSQSPAPLASSHLSQSPLGAQQQSPVPSGSTSVSQRQPVPSRRMTTSQTSAPPRGPRSHPRTLPPPPYILPKAGTFPAEKLSMRAQSHPQSAEGSSSSSSQSGPSGPGSGSRQSLHPITERPESMHTGTAQPTVHEAMPHAHAVHSPESHSSVHQPWNSIPNPQTVVTININSQSTVETALNPIPVPQTVVPDSQAHQASSQGQFFSHVSDALNPMPEPPPPSYDTPGMPHIPAQDQPTAPPPPQYNQPTLPVPQSPQSPPQASNSSISAHQYQVPPPPPLENTGTSPNVQHAQHSPSMPHPGSQQSPTIQNATQSTQQPSFQSTSQSLTHQQMQSLIDAYHEAQEASQASSTSSSPQPQYHVIDAPVQQLPSVQSSPVSPAANGGQHIPHTHTHTQHQQPVHGGVPQSPISQTHHSHPQYVQTSYQANTDIGPQPQPVQTHVPSHVQTPVLGQQPQAGQAYSPSHLQAPFQANGNVASQSPPISGQQLQAGQAYAPSHVQTPYQTNGDVAPQSLPTPGQQSQTAQSPAPFNTYPGVQRPPSSGQMQQSPNMQGHLQMQPPLVMSAGVQRPPPRPPQGSQQQNVNTPMQIPHHLSINPAQVQQSPNGVGSVQMSQGLNINAGVQRPPLRPPTGQVLQSPNATSPLQPLSMNAGVQGPPPRPLSGQVQQTVNASGPLPTSQFMNMNAGVQSPPLRPSLPNQQPQNAQGPVYQQQSVPQVQQQWPPEPPSQMLPQQSMLQQQNMSSAEQQQDMMQNLLHMISNLGLQQPQQLQQQPSQSPQPYSQPQQPELNPSNFMSQLQRFMSQAAHQDPPSPSYVQQVHYLQPNNATPSQATYQEQGMTVQSVHHEEEQAQYDAYEQANSVGYSQQETEFTFDTSYQQLDAAGQGQQDMWNLAQQDPSVLQSLQGYQQAQMERMYQSQGQQQGTLDVLQTHQQGQDIQSWSVDPALQPQNFQGSTDTTSVYQSQGQQETLNGLQTYQQGQDIQSWSLDVTLQQQDLQGFTDTTFSESFSESHETSC